MMQDISSDEIWTRFALILLQKFCWSNSAAMLFCSLLQTYKNKFQSVGLQIKVFQRNAKINKIKFWLGQIIIWLHWTIQTKIWQKSKQNIQKNQKAKDIIGEYSGIKIF